MHAFTSYRMCYVEEVMAKIDAEISRTNDLTDNWEVNFYYRN